MHVKTIFRDPGAVSGKKIWAKKSEEGKEELSFAQIFFSPV